MNKYSFNIYSSILCRDNYVQVYGHAGRPVLFIPCQDGHSCDFENFHMTDVLASRIESGELTVFTIDTIDQETWSDKYTDPAYRSGLHERWMNYIFDELAPAIYERTSDDRGILVFGCSMGATHAVNLYLRRPDIFTGLLALSGIYSADYGFGGYRDEAVYFNSPVEYMRNLPEGHPYIEIFNRQRAVICVGQGAWEQPETTRELDAICSSKGINIWFDYWGYDVNHDWDWWYKQTEYFMPYLMDEG